MFRELGPTIILPHLSSTSYYYFFQERSGRLRPSFPPVRRRRPGRRLPLRRRARHGSQEHHFHREGQRHPAVQRGADGETEAGLHQGIIFIVVFS